MAFGRCNILNLVLRFHMHTFSGTLYVYYKENVAFEKGSRNDPKNSVRNVN